MNGPAALISFLLPGGGQMFAGHVFRGLLWFVLVVIGYALLVVPGLVLHFLCIVFAARCPK